MHSTLRKFLGITFGVFLCLSSFMAAYTSVQAQQSPFALAPEGFAIHYTPADSMFHLAFKGFSGSEVPYTLKYKTTDGLEHAVTDTANMGSDKIVRDSVKLGTCSGADCVPHMMTGGSLELKAPGSTRSVSFEVHNGSSLTVKEADSFLIFSPQVGPVYTHPHSAAVTLEFKKIAAGMHYARIAKTMSGFEFTTNLAANEYVATFVSPAATPDPKAEQARLPLEPKVLGVQTAAPVVQEIVATPVEAPSIFYRIFMFFFGWWWE